MEKVFGTSDWERQQQILTPSLYPRQYVKKRRRVTKTKLNWRGGAWLQILRYFDDGSVENEIITTDLSEEFEMYMIEIDGVRTSMFGLYFPRENISILGDINRLTGKYLLERLRNKGVSFKSSVSPREISIAFENSLIPVILNTADVLNIPGHAGWFGNQFYHKDSVMMPEIREHGDYPILKKGFEKFSASVKAWKQYFQIFRSIPTEVGRFWMMAYPMLSMVKSLLDDEISTKIPVLNIVALEPVDLCDLCGMLQIFSRERLAPIRLDVSEKAVRKIVDEAHDEVLILDTRSDEEESQYYRNKLRRHGLKIAKMIARETSPYNEANVLPCAGCVLISDEQFLYSWCLNLFANAVTPKRENAMQDRKAIAMVWSAFIRRIEADVESFRNLIRRVTVERNSVVHLADEILQWFWSKEGINWKKEAGFESEIREEEFLELYSEAPEELLDRFIGAVRRQADRYFFYDKKVKTSSNAIFFDEDHIWIPSKIMKKILVNEGLVKVFPQIALELKKRKLLICDTEGLTKKLQVNGKRFETYVFRRSLFDKAGMLSIVDLGKENGRC